jgi:hypothetical protein
MEPITSFSSQLMTGLLVWRNPQGSEVNWLPTRFQGQEPKIDNRCLFYGRIFTTQLGLALITSLAVIETVVYSIIAALLLIRYSNTHPSAHFFMMRLQSSSFTIVWGSLNFLAANYQDSTLYTKECFERWELDSLREVDAAACELVMEQCESPLRDQGAAFIINELLNNEPEKVRQQFIEMDNSLTELLIMKTALIYLLGSRYREPPPLFFKENTRKLIVKFQQIVARRPDMAHILSIHTYTHTFEEIQKMPPKKIRLLHRIAGEELQNSFFLQKCWPRAIEMLPSP